MHMDVECEPTWSVGTLHTSKYPYRYKYGYGYGYGVWVYMECRNTPHSIICIWIETWIWIQSMDLHGVWRHFTSQQIHMDMDMVHVCILSLLHTLDIKIDLFKIGTILFIIIRGL